MPFPGNFYWQGDIPESFANFVTFCSIGRAGLLLPKRKCLPKKSCSQFAAHYNGRQRQYLYFCPKGFDCLGSYLGRIQHLPLFQESLQYIRLPADKFLQSLSDGPTASQTTQKQNEIENVALKYTKSRDLK